MKSCNCLDYCMKDDPHSKNPDGDCLMNTQKTTDSFIEWLDENKILAFPNTKTFRDMRLAWNAGMENAAKISDSCSHDCSIAAKSIRMEIE